MGGLELVHQPARERLFRADNRQIDLRADMERAAQRAGVSSEKELEAFYRESFLNKPVPRQPGRTPLERAAPAELKFWINGKEAAGGTVQRTVPLTFTASETFDVGRDTMSPVADDYFEKAPFPFEGELGKLHFKNLLDEKPAFERSPDDD